MEGTLQPCFTLGRGVCGEEVRAGKDMCQPF